MPSPIVDDLTGALNFLVDQPDYVELKQEIMTLANTRLGKFTGDHYPLNVLVDYARSRGGSEWLEPLWRVADKAAHAPVPPPVSEPTPTTAKAASQKTKHAEYQRAYMKATRGRDRKACVLYHQMLGPTLKKAMPRGLIGEERKAFLDEVHKLWASRKAEVLENVIYAAERNALANEFWAEIDRQLDAGLAGDLSAARHVLGLKDKK